MRIARAGTDWSGDLDNIRRDITNAVQLSKEMGVVAGDHR